MPPDTAAMAPRKQLSHCSSQPKTVGAAYHPVNDSPHVLFGCYSFIMLRRQTYMQIALGAAYHFPCGVGWLVRRRRPGAAYQFPAHAGWQF